MNLLTAMDVILFTIYNPCKNVELHLKNNFNKYSLVYLESSYFIISEEEKIKLLKLCNLNSEYNISIIHNSI